MTVKQLLRLAPRVARYNLKVIFAGKFIWFLLAALGFFCLFMFQAAWERTEINEGVLYNMMLFPAVLLIFYPAVFGIQNDEDARILELLFGIPNYKYKVWGIRLAMIYVAIFFILVGFGYLAVVLIYPINPFEMAIQLMFPLLFYGNLAFMFSTITRSGNGTAVVMIILSIFIFFLSNVGFTERTFWNILVNPFRVPGNILPAIWEGVIIKSRIFLLIGSIIWGMTGLLKLQQREKFIG